MDASSAVRQLKPRFVGKLLAPGDGDYDAARAVFNLAIDRRPALIARCTNPEDVILALNFARAENWPIAIRGTGHNVAGFAVCDDGLVIDLALMKEIKVDPAARTVWVEAGCYLG